MQSLLAAGLLLLLATLNLGVGPELQSLPLTLAFVVAAAAVELASIPLPQGARVSGSVALYLTAALHPAVGARGAVVVLVVASLARWLGLPQGSTGLRQNLADAAAAMVALSLPLLGELSGLLQPDQRAPAALLGLVGYLWCYQWLVPWISQAQAEELRARQRLFPLILAAGTLPFLMLASKWGWLAGVPLLLVAQRLASPGPQTTSSAAESPPATPLQPTSDYALLVEELRHELARQREERELLEELTRAFAAGPEFDEALQLWLKMLGRLVGCDTIVFFRHGPEGLRPYRWSACSSNLENQQLLRLEEPLVSQCWQRRRLLLSRPEHLEGERLLEDRACVAVPLRDLGVLYLGRADEVKFEREELHRLAIVADQAIPALNAARRQTELTEALRAGESANRALQQSLGQQQALLSSFMGLATGLSQQQVLVNFAAQCDRLLEVSAAGSLVRVAADEPIWHSWPEGEVFNVEHLQNLAAAVAKNRKPLLLNDFDDSRFQAVYSQRQSVLAVPLVFESEVLAVLVVGATHKGAFSRTHLDLLQAFGFYAASVLNNARLYEELLTANTALKESQAQLIQSGKMAAVGQLAAGVAHELNTPLGSIIIAIETGLLGIDEKDAQHFEIALNESLRAKDIIERLLYYSRDARYGQRSLDLDKVVQDTIDLNRHQFRLDRIEIKSELGGPPRLQGNENEIQQVVSNLLLNARDAAMESEGERLVTLSTRVEDEAVVLEVRDTGRGVSDEARDRLFEPFFTTKPVGKGTGLGLSLSRQIVESHGGELVLKETSKSGSTFRLTLPPGDGEAS